jgi:hypothetical protein
MKFSHRLICFVSAVVSPLLLFSAFALFAYRQSATVMFGVLAAYTLIRVLPSLLGRHQDETGGGWFPISLIAAILIALRIPAIRERLNRPILNADLTGWMSLGIAGLVTIILICIGVWRLRKERPGFQ